MGFRKCEALTDCAVDEKKKIIKDAVKNIFLTFQGNGVLENFTSRVHTVWNRFCPTATIFNAIFE